MDEETKNLVDAWIKISTALCTFRDPNSNVEEANYWAFERLDDLVKNDPEKAWPLILEIRNATNDSKVLAQLAAGPLEDLINSSGDSFIDRIEALAKVDQDFRRLIGGIWPRRDLSEELLLRLKAVALEPPPWS